MCDTPYHMNNPAYPIKSRDKIIPVPCGKCYPCKMRRVNSWVFRLIQQEKVEQSAHFITLTYDNDHVPITDNKYMTIDKRDVQLFMKRLRKAHVKKYGKEHRIKYYLCGEYGSKTKRPHYHAVMFNVDTELIDKAWHMGSSHYGHVTGASISYTLKYMAKATRIPEHSNDDRQPEFALMSKRLGSNYLSPKIKEYHQQDIERNFVVLEGGIKLPMPRYYRDKIFTEEQRLRQNAIIKQKALEKEEAAEQSFRRKYGDDMDYYAFRNHQRKIAKLETAFKGAQKNRDKL